LDFSHQELPGVNGGIDEFRQVVSGGKTLGYLPEGMKNGFSFKALIPDYSINGLPSVAGYMLSAVAGAALLLIIFKLLANEKNKKNDK